MSFNVVNPYSTFRDTAGNVRANGTVTFYDNGTTTKASIFSDEALSVAQTNPYTLDASGRIVGDVKFSGLLTIQEMNADGSDIITTDDVATLSSSLVATIADESTDTTCFPLFVTAATGSQALKSGSNLTFNSNTGELGATILKPIGTTDSTSGTTGSFNTGGGVGAVKDIISDANIKAKGTTDSSSDTTGALQSAGGLGVIKTAWIGQDIVLDERADHAATSAAGMGIFWVKDDAPNTPMFTDDAATDHGLSSQLQTEIATTSGTTHDFTIPSWVKKITIMLAGISTNGTSKLLIQIGDAGGIETSGYLGASSEIASASAGTSNFTAGFGINTSSAATILHGAITLSLRFSTSVAWVASGVLSRSDAANTYTVAGKKETSAALTQIRLTTVNGTDAFDAGVINIILE